jgi:hypothetical protein
MLSEKVAKSTNDGEAQRSFLTETEIEEIRKEALEKALKAKHDWRQRGNAIVCIACANEHGFYIKPTQRLIRVTKEGEPIIEDKPLR